MSFCATSISFGYKNKQILHNVSLAANPGEVISLVGPNGSGKTTFLKCIGRIHKPWSGSVHIDDNDLGHLSARELARLIGYVPQDTGTSFPINVLNAVMLGRTPHVQLSATEGDLDIVTDCLCTMGLSDLSFRMLTELSGGERQRVYIARALAQEPKVLLLDEPTSNLDLRHQLETLRIVREAARERGLVVLMAIHDLNLASRFSDRIFMLKQGKLHVQGACADVLTSENIVEVYGVNALVRVENDLPIVMPLDVCPPAEQAAGA